ncbi:MAG: aminotransferase class V-fold PLP-dependent enzyme [Candidatus Marinamargulisbacteria bacterium]
MTHTRSITEFRSNFDTSSLMFYFNNASKSPLPHTHQVLLNTYITLWNQGKHDPYYYNFTHTDLLKDELAIFLACDTNQIALSLNVASGFATIVHGYPWSKNNSVILLEDDYPSITQPFQSNPNIHIQWARSSNGGLVPETLEEMITPNTVGVAIGWVHYQTGYVNDIEKISVVCKKHNIYLWVDATQALGVIPIHLKNLSIDFLTASLYKWCFCPPGIAVSIFSHQMMADLQPLSAGVFSQFDRGIRSRPNRPSQGASRFEYGNPNVLGILCAHETFRWFNTIGISAIYGHYTTLVCYFIAQLKRKGTPLAINYHEASMASIVSFIHPSPEMFLQTLSKNGGQVTYRHGMIRVSPGIFHNTHHIDRLLSFL